MTKNESNALRELRNNKNIIIKQADKGEAAVIMDRKYYSDKILAMLKDEETHSELRTHTDEKVMEAILQLRDKFKGILTNREEDYRAKFNYQTSSFYGLPKIHQNRPTISSPSHSTTTYLKIGQPQDLKFRPIVGGPTCPTSHLSNVIDILIKPLVTFVRSKLRDNTEFIYKLPRNVPSETILTSFDIIGLYTNIPHDLGIKAIEYWLTLYP